MEDAKLDTLTITQFLKIRILIIRKKGQPKMTVQKAEGKVLLKIKNIMRKAFKRKKEPINHPK